LVSFDELALWFSKPFLFPSIPHLKDLCELLKAQGQGKSTVTSSGKKVRLSTVNFSSLDSSQRSLSRLAFNGDSMSPWSSKRPGTPTNTGGIKDKLIDSFFHQHKALQQLCEMIVDRAITNFSTTVSQSLIQSVFKNEATSFEEYFNKTPITTFERYMVLLHALEVKVQKQATTKMHTDFDRIIKGSLQLLAPPETNPTVVEIACSLAMTHATQKGKNTIRSLISEEKRKLADEFVRKEKKFKAGVPLSSSKRGQAQPRNSTGSDNTSYESIIELSALLKSVNELEDCKLEQLRQQTTKVIVWLRTCYIGAGCSQYIVDFELQILSMLKAFFSNPSSQCPSLLKAIIEVVEVLARLGKLGYSTASNTEELESLLCNTGNMLELVNQAKHARSHMSSISHEAIGNFLFMLIEGSLLCYRPLENALLHSAKVGDDGKLVSKILLDRLASSQSGKADSTDGLVIMVRLQKLLRGDQGKRGQHPSTIQPRELFNDTRSPDKNTIKAE